MTNRTRAAPNRAQSSVPVASPKLLTISEAKVAAGDLTEWAMNGELPMTRATATVSPRARPMARVKPPRMPVRAPGTTTLRRTCHLVAPRARAPSTCSWGTTARTSREMATMVGSTITNRMMPASSRPTPSLGPLNSPVHPSTEVRNGSTVLRKTGASTIRPHSP